MTISSASPPPAPHRGTLAWAIAVLFGVTGLGSAAVAVALPAIANDLNLTAGRAALIVSCYSLALAVGSAIFGRLGDFFGIRLPLLVGISIMVTAACAGALVDSLPALIATRTLQGLGAAAVPALTIAAVQALFAGDSRARAMATYSGIGATINALGPVAGALLVDPFGWRPVVAIPALTLLIVPLVRRDLPTDRQQGATLDPAGVALIGGAAIGAVMSLQAATLGPIVAAAGGALLLVCGPTAVLRSRWRPHGVVPARLVSDRIARRSLLTAVSLPAAANRWSLRCRAALRRPRTVAARARLTMWNAMLHADTDVTAEDLSNLRSPRRWRRSTRSPARPTPVRAAEPRARGRAG